MLPPCLVSYSYLYTTGFDRFYLGWRRIKGTWLLLLGFNVEIIDWLPARVLRSRYSIDEFTFETKNVSIQESKQFWTKFSVVGVQNSESISQTILEFVVHQIFIAGKELIVQIGRHLKSKIFSIATLLGEFKPKEGWALTLELVKNKKLQVWTIRIPKQGTYPSIYSKNPPKTECSSLRSWNKQ